MDRRAIAKAIAMALALTLVFAVICALLSCAVAADGTEPALPTPDDQLDAVRYAPPAWATVCMTDCWHVQDRQRHHDWWLVKLDGQWVALDAGEVREP